MLKQSNIRQFVWRSRTSLFVSSILPAIICIVVIWYPFGLSLGGMLEEWDILFLMLKNPTFWNSFPGQPLSSVFSVRPLQITPHFIAHRISENSFAGFHVVLMVACGLRVVAGATIGYFLFRRRGYAAACGMLFLVFPADTEQFILRTFHISAALALMLSSTALTITALLAKSSRSRLLRIALATAASCIAVLIYEPVFTLYALCPLLLFGRYGLGFFLTIVRRRSRIVIAWLLGPLLNVSYLAYATLVLKSSYQENSVGNGALSSIISNLHYLISSTAYRIFFDAWASAYDILANRTQFFGYLAVVLLLTYVAILLPRDGSTRPIRHQRLYRFVLVGLVACIAGYLPFMVAESHMRITQRTFMATAAGATIIVVSLVAFVGNRWRRTAYFVLSTFVFIGFVAQLYQFDQFTRAYNDVIRPYLSYVSDQSDPTKKFHLVIDSSGHGGYLNGLYPTVVAYGPSVRRQRADDVYILCKNYEPSAIGEFRRCELQDSKWIITDAAMKTLTLDSKDVDVIRVGKDFDPTYTSKASTWLDLGSYNASASIFKPATGQSDRYTCRPDGMWGYSHYCRGEGWTDGIFIHRSFRHETYIATQSSNASLLFSLKPNGARYMLRIKLFSVLTDDVFRNIKVSINENAMSVKRVDGDTFEGEISSSALIDGQNEISFLSSLEVRQQLSLAVSSVDLIPIGSRDASQH